MKETQTFDYQQFLEIQKENARLKEHITTQENMFGMTLRNMGGLNQELKFAKEKIKEQNLLLEKIVADRTIELLAINNQLNALLYRASHDMKGPVSTSEGLLNLIELTNDQEEIKEMSNLMRLTLRKLSRLLDGLSFLGRLKTEKSIISRIDFDTFFTEFKDKLYQNHSHRFPVIHTQLPENRDFNSDPDILHVIFREIFENSIVFGRNERLEITFVMDITLDHITFSITDNGYGIREGVLSLVTEMFFRGSEKSEGSGMGLFLVQSAVEHLQGELFISSGEKNGTTVKIIIPNNTF
ncbi:MAG: HAMP domain-containing histidine kinase [Sporocytophaga sp.]|uniref:sensor histidine kinase n=1 Tax=Sporocytophaga sp. TaxID=2231183 RepID=UPI001B2F38AF|nr:HAMP domain-containing sensor histidine kinase [Sporocytophaga sp.]MBO9703820.1 HAMP domain-containing histidine kinase [Sporocytophaga sp.]